MESSFPPVKIMLDATSLINNVFVLVLQREGFCFDHGVRWIPALQMLASVPCSAQWVRVANTDQFIGVRKTLSNFLIFLFLLSRMQGKDLAEW